MEVNFLKFEMLNSHISLLIFPTIFIIMIYLYKYSKPWRKTIYLIDYACFKPPLTMRVTHHTFIEHSLTVFKNNPKAARLQIKILERSGLGEETCMPPAIHYIPPQPTMQRARDEAHMVIFSAIDDLFAKTKFNPNDVDILVTNCSIFCPNPSLSSMIVNKYKMRENIKSFSLSGMGCSANPISVGLASRLLQVHPKSYALVVSTEIITPNVYTGSERSMLVPACLFRIGCAALLLTNKEIEKNRAKYKLLHIVQTNKGAEDIPHKSVTLEEDCEGNVGISLSKDLMVVAGEALKSNIAKIGPLILPISEIIRFGLTFIAQKILQYKKIKPYVPNFSKVIHHFCIHAGGRAVIDEVQKGLRLKDNQVEASRMALHRFGNTSSSSIWYELSYNEAKGRIKKGSLVWQIAFGSGFKCNSIIWKANRNILVGDDGIGPWKDCIDKYPVHIPEIIRL